MTIITKKQILDNTMNKISLVVQKHHTIMDKHCVTNRHICTSFDAFPMLFLILYSGLYAARAVSLQKYLKIICMLYIPRYIVNSMMCLWSRMIESKLRRWGKKCRHKDFATYRQHKYYLLFIPKVKNKSRIRETLNFLTWEKEEKECIKVKYLIYSVCCDFQFVVIFTFFFLRPNGFFQVW